MMSGSADHKKVPAWVWAAAAFLAIGAVVVLASRDRRREPPQSFRYDVTEYEAVDPSLVVFSETASIDPGIPGLHALAASADGRIFVAGESMIAVYGGDGQAVARYAVNGAATCLAVAPNGDLFLGMTDHIEVLGADGLPKTTWASQGERIHLTSIAVSAEDVYAADAGNRVVLRFDRQGNMLGRIGEKDSSRDIPGFIVPSPCFDVAFDNTGALWAVNPGRHGLEQYRPNGELVSSWYRASMEIDGFCGCCNPAHIAFRSDGSLITAEKGLARVKVYSVDQKLVGFVAPPEAFHESPTGPFSDDLDAPIVDLAVDAADRVLVIDAGRNVVRFFEAKGAV